LEYLLIIAGAMVVSAMVLSFLGNVGTNTDTENQMHQAKCQVYPNETLCSIADFDGDGIKDCYWKDSQCKYNSLLKGLVFLYSFELEDAHHETTIVDVSSNNNNGVLRTYDGNENKIIEGKRGNALLLTDSSDYIILPVSQSIIKTLQKHDFSFSAWVWFNDDSDEDRGIIAIGTNGAYQHLHILRRNQKIAFAFYSDGGLYMGNRILSSGKWWHITCTWDSKNMLKKIYVNGELDKTFDLTNHNQLNIPDNPEQHVIGKYWGGSITGKIDEVALWNRVLSEEEVQRLYSKGIT